MVDTFEHRYRSLAAKDPRFDGWFLVAVTSTGIYCRPSCPARVPKRENVRFYPTAAAAQLAGFRACKRCRPDAAPGSPQWDARGDLVGRAMRLIADGVVERDGVGGLAAELGYSARHIHRQLVTEVGAGPQALARARRAQTARLLIETTDLPFGAVAFAADFPSIRQFNETVRAVFAATPTELRRRRRTPGATSPGAITLRLAHRAPLDATSLLGFLGARAVPGVEDWDGRSYRRTLRLPRADGIVELAPDDGFVRATLRLADLRDLGAAVARCRRLLDLDADPEAVDERLARDPLLRPLVHGAPGRRVPGSVDGFELAARAVLGQQVSIGGAATLAGRLVRACAAPVSVRDGTLTHLFPDPARVDGAPDDAFSMPASRRRALRALARAVGNGELALHPGADRDETHDRLLALPGFGEWTATYVAMRVLGDPDAFLPSDLGVRRALERLGQPGDPASATRRAERWRPWRAYGLMYLWGAHAGVTATAGRARRRSHVPARPRVSPSEPALLTGVH